MRKLVSTLASLLVASTSYAQSLYCPQNTQYIKLGMTEPQVISACGNPLTKQKSKTMATQKVPVTQYIYNSAGAQKAFYGEWQVSTGRGGTQVIVNVINNKVSSISMAGNSSNAFSLCGGTSVSVGDPVYKLTSACGSASAINNTYINQPTGQTNKSEVWTYQINQYQPAVRLTFVNGKLQSID